MNLLKVSGSFAFLALFCVLNNALGEDEGNEYCFKFDKQGNDVDSDEKEYCSTLQWNGNAHECIKCANNLASTGSDEQTMILPCPQNGVREKTSFPVRMANEVITKFLDSIDNAMVSVQFNSILIEKCRSNVNGVIHRNTI